MRWRPSGFTLVELLVVIAIISILAAMLLPVLSQAVHAAQDLSCLSQVKQQGVYLAVYCSDFDNVMPGGNASYMEGHHAFHTHYPDHFWFSWGTIWRTQYIDDLSILACPTYTANPGAKLQGNNSRNSSYSATTPREVVRNLQRPVNSMYRAHTTYVLMGHAPRRKASPLPNISEPPLKYDQLAKHSPVPLVDYLFWPGYTTSLASPPATNGTGWVHRNQLVNIGVYDGHAQPLRLSEIGYGRLNNVGLYHGRTDGFPTTEGFWSELRSRFGE